jgi:threonine dehydrogenase-like Zn-dependent dehydrogenase
VKITATAICGSDLHLLDGYVPTMQNGDVMGHEFMGEVVEVGPGVDRDKLRVGDRVVVPFPIGCGACCACQNQLWSCCENTNPNAGVAEKMFGHPSPASTATRTSPAASPAARPSTPAWCSPTSTR